MQDEPKPEKINRVIEEMKKTGVWKSRMPAWVNEYDSHAIINEHHFGEWLQFVYLPNLLQQGESDTIAVQKKLIVPQAIKFFGEDVKKGKLLQLLIELDSL